MKRQRNMFQIKKQDKTLKKELNETEISKLPDKEFKVMVIKMLPKFGRRMDEHSMNINREIENIGKYQTKVITEPKNTLEGSNGRLDEVEQISVLENKAMKNTHTVQQNEKRTKKNGDI